jgi:hypothetical protein
LVCAATRGAALADPAIPVTALPATKSAVSAARVPVIAALLPLMVTL